MIKFEIDGSKEGVEVFIDAEGVDELIGYLNFIKEKKDHMHLNAGNELSEELSEEDIKIRNVLVTHVKLIYMY